MAKDPAFLFYSSDFLTGTTFFNDEQVGKYIRLLCYQHQFGKLTEQQMVSVCKGRDEIIFEKFSKDENGFYSQSRLSEEIEKRKKHAEKQRENARKRWNKSEQSQPYATEIRLQEPEQNQKKEMAMPLHNNGIATAMPLENENEIENRNRIEIIKKGVQGENGPEPKIDSGHQVLLVPELMGVWKAVKPDYIQDPATDFAPLRSIGENIAKASNISNYTGLESIDKIKAAWTMLCNFIVKDDFFKNYQLSQVAKYYNNIASKYKSSLEHKEVKTVVKPSIIQINMQAAQGARDLVAAKYGKQTNNR